jgi:hypothetical protein
MCSNGGRTASCIIRVLKTMSLTASIIIFGVGIAIAALTYGLLRHRISEAIALGVSVTVMSLTMYPLTFWITHGPYQSFTMYLTWSVLGGLSATGLRSLMKPK